MKNRIIELTTSIIGTILVMIGFIPLIQWGMSSVANGSNAPGVLLYVLSPVIFSIVGIVFVFVTRNRHKVAVGIPLVFFGGIVILLSWALTKIGQLVIGGDMVFWGIIGGLIMFIGGLIALIKK